MREPADGWLERGGIGIHYLEWGADPALPAAPAVLLLHGLSSNAHYWGRVAQRLASHRIVALDQRGHGLTGRPPRVPRLPDGFAMRELLADATLAIEQLSLGRVVLAGHSWGATVGLELAAELGDRIAGFVFIDGPVQSAANLFSWDDAQSYMQPPLPRYSSFADAVADVRRDFDGAWADDLEPFVMSRVIQDGDSLVLTLTSDVRLELLRGLYESPVDQLWAVLAAPAAALLARRGPAAMIAGRERGAKLLGHAAPHVSVTWFDTPHDIPLFAPDEVAEAIASVSRSEPAAAEKLQD